MLKNRPQAILINASQREIAHNDSVVPNDLTNEHPWERVGQVGERERERETNGQQREIEKGDPRENEWNEREKRQVWVRERKMTEGLQC